MRPDLIHVAELEEFGCPLEAINKLESLSIITLRDLLTLTPKKLSALPQIGKVRGKAIIEAVKAHRAMHKW